MLFQTLSVGTLLQSVMSQQYNCLMDLYTNFTQTNLPFMKIYLPSTFMPWYVRAKMIVHVHAFMIELDQHDY